MVAWSDPFQHISIRERGGTSRVGEQHRSHHQVAAVDVEGRAGDVAGGLGGGEANQIGALECSPEPRHRIGRGEAFEGFAFGVRLGLPCFFGQLGGDNLV